MDVLAELEQLAASRALPAHDDLLSRTEAAIAVLEDEPASYRPRTDGGTAGGLLDFTDAPERPLLVVPDLHGRTEFFLHVMRFPLARWGIGGGTTVLDALAQHALRVVCVGDLFHSERRCKERWLSAWDEYGRGDCEGAAMTAEMQENLALYQMVLRVKGAFPASFHFLKGNHENILNESERGNHPFRKFADEGNMVYDFMASHYGDAVLHVMSLWEHALPVCAAFPSCVVSHAEPREPYRRKQIVAYHDHPAVVEGLTWTANDEAVPGSVGENLRMLLGASRAKTAVWLAGHRPTGERYALRQDGALVQIHSPDREQVAVLLPGERFDAERDIRPIA